MYWFVQFSHQTYIGEPINKLVAANDSNILPYLMLPISLQTLANHCHFMKQILSQIKLLMLNIKFELICEVKPRRVHIWQTKNGIFW